MYLSNQDPSRPRLFSNCFVHILRGLGLLSRQPLDFTKIFESATIWKEFESIWEYYRTYVKPVKNEAISIFDLEQIA